MRTKKYTPLDVERYIQEDHKSKDRTSFERDRARILHSSSFRRLGFKTQVMLAGDDDFARTRLTHSVEVAQVGRQLAKRFGCDQDLVDAACLAHDLGHPPFGHNGERILNELAEDIGGFEGNAQTFRILTRLEPKVIAGINARKDATDGENTPDTADDTRSYGLNLTRATLNACIKYPWDRAEGAAIQEEAELKNFAADYADSDGNQPDTSTIIKQTATSPISLTKESSKVTKAVKFGVYDDDLEIFEWVRQGSERRLPCIEAQLMNVADDIAYCVHDLEDSIVLFKINPVDVFNDAAREKIIEETVAAKPEFTADDLENAFNRLQADNLLIKDFSGTRLQQAELKDTTSGLIGRFVNGCLSTIFGPEGSSSKESKIDPVEVVRKKYNGKIVLPKDILDEIVFLKGIGLQYYRYSKEQYDIYNKERNILINLFNSCMSDKTARKEIMSPAYLYDFDLADTIEKKKRVVIDQIAAFTDISGQKRDRL